MNPSCGLAGGFEGHYVEGDSLQAFEIASNGLTVRIAKACIRLDD